MNTLNGYCTSMNINEKNELLFSYSNGLTVKYNNEYQPIEIYTPLTYDSIINSKTYNNGVITSNNVGNILIYSI